MTSRVFYRVADEILAWLPEIHAARERAGLTAAKYSDALILALLHRETFPIGSASSHTEGTSFYGGLQMFDAYVIDATQRLKIPAFPARDLMGKPSLQLDLFFAYAERYNARHDYRASWVAALHKAGPGSMRAVQRAIDDGKATGLVDALENHVAIFNDDFYVKTWMRLFDIYRRWVDDENGSLGVCSAQYMGDLRELQLPQIPGLAN